MKWVVFHVNVLLTISNAFFSGVSQPT